MSVVRDIETSSLGLDAFADFVKKLTLKQNVKLNELSPTKLLTVFDTFITHSTAQSCWI